MASIAEVNTYPTDIRHRADYAAVREEFFGGKCPLTRWSRWRRWRSPNS